MSNDDGRILELTEAKKLLAAKERDLQSEQPKKQTKSLDETTVKLLCYIANPGHKNEVPTLIKYMGLHPERAKHHLHLLEEGNYIYAIRISLGYDSPTTYHLAQKGREFLLENSLI